MYLLGTSVFDGVLFTKWDNICYHEILTTVAMKTALFGGVTLCSLVEVYKSFKSTCCLRHLPWWRREKYDLKQLWRGFHIPECSQLWKIPSLNNLRWTSFLQENFPGKIMQKFFSLLTLCYMWRGADKSLARPTSRCIFFMVRIFILMLVFIYIYIYI